MKRVCHLPNYFVRVKGSFGLTASIKEAVSIFDAPIPGLKLVSCKYEKWINIARVDQIRIYHSEAEVLEHKNNGNAIAATPSDFEIWTFPMCTIHSSRTHQTLILDIV